jgi:integrase
MTDRPERIRVGDRVVIYPRGKKRIYVADFWFDGQHRRQTLGTANKKVALSRATKLAHDLTCGSFQQAPPPKTIASAVEDYIAYLRTEGRASKTLVKYQGIYQVLLAFVAANHIVRLGQFTTVWFDKFRAVRAVDHHQKTLYVEGVVIKQLLKWCRSRKFIIENPISDYKLAKPPLIPKQGPGLSEVNLILAAVPKRMLPMIAILAFTGMRAGELQRLQPQDLDLDGGWIHVVSREGLETKTRDTRKVPIHPRLGAILAVLPKMTKPWAFTMPASTKYPESDHWINIKKLNEVFQKVLKSLGLPAGREAGFTLHSLRHFFETFCVNAGVTQRAVDTWLGHRSDKSMAAVYYRLSDHDSVVFMKKVPFGTGVPAAEAG